MKAMEGKKKQPMHDKKHHHEHVPSYMKDGSSDSPLSEESSKKK